MVGWSASRSGVNCWYQNGANATPLGALFLSQSKVLTLVLMQSLIYTKLTAHRSCCLTWQFKKNIANPLSGEAGKALGDRAANLERLLGKADEPCCKINT